MSLTLSGKNLADLRFANGKPLRSDVQARDNCAAALAKVSRSVANLEFGGYSVAHLNQCFAYLFSLKRLYARSITNSPHPRCSPADLRRLYAALAASDLEELYLGDLSLTLELSAALQRCRCLRILELHALHVSAVIIVQLLQGCKTIEVLGLQWYDGTEEDVSNIMQAGRHQLKAFEMTGGWENGFPIHIFTLLLNHHSWLERIKVGVCIFDRTTGELDMLVDDSSPLPYFDAVMERCSFVMKKVTVQVFNDNPAFLSKLPALSQLIISGTEQLTIQMRRWSPDTAPLLKAMLLQCTLLKVLKVNIPIHNDDIKQIATNSKALEHIEMRDFQFFHAIFSTTDH